jgi:hypothetical protein
MKHIAACLLVQCVSLSKLQFHLSSVGNGKMLTKNECVFFFAKERNTVAEVKECAKTQFVAVV